MRRLAKSVFAGVAALGVVACTYSMPILSGPIPVNESRKASAKAVLINNIST
jgi:hypothetical protein